MKLWGKISCLTIFKQSGPILYSSRITAGEGLSLVTLKQKFIFSLVHWKKEFNPMWVNKPCTRILVFLLDQMWGLDCHGRFLWRELSGLTTSHFAQGVQLWISLIPLTGKQYKMKEHREQSPILFFLQISYNLSPLPFQLECQKNYLERP